MRRRFHLVVMLLAGIAACARAHADPSVADGDAGAGAGAGAGAEANANAEGNASEGAGSGEGATSAPTVTSGAAAAADAGTDGITLWAFGIQAPIFSASEWPPKDPGKADEERRGVVRLGYLRKGEHVAVTPQVCFMCHFMPS